MFELANQKNNEIDISYFVVELMTHPNPTQSTTSGKYEVKTKNYKLAHNTEIGKMTPSTRHE